MPTSAVRNMALACTFSVTAYYPISLSSLILFNKIQADIRIWWSGMELFGKCL